MFGVGEVGGIGGLLIVSEKFLCFKKQNQLNKRQGKVVPVLDVS